MTTKSQVIKSISTAIKSRNILEYSIITNILESLLFEKYTTKHGKIKLESWLSLCDDGSLDYQEFEANETSGEVIMNLPNGEFILSIEHSRYKQSNIKLNNLNTTIKFGLFERSKQQRESNRYYQIDVAGSFHYGDKHTLIPGLLLNSYYSNDEYFNLSIIHIINTTSSFIPHHIECTYDLKIAITPIDEPTFTWHDIFTCKNT